MERADQVEVLISRAVVAHGLALARLGDALGGAETKRGARIVAEACAIVQDVHDLFVERAEASEASDTSGTK